MTLEGLWYRVPNRPRSARNTSAWTKAMTMTKSGNWPRNFNTRRIFGRGVKRPRPSSGMAGFKARRWVVERTHSWLNRFRRILIRREKRADTYLALRHLACDIITWRVTGLLG